MRKSKDLSFVLALLGRVAEDPALNLAQRRAILRGRRLLKQRQQGGAKDRVALNKAVRLISESIWAAFGPGDAE